ncbi:hypothetical protein TEA_006470 [Camellia sinensis var. sinensis]|uniref:Uncharacterized protein n=1 Tax=Camellia sinensis var. sinensis TaxID=542762 RepID=A0A4S4F1R1_CAMSN|nr:hypothetical protein TEA_006470 [Camellia sinensis var. sinensis]
MECGKMLALAIFVSSVLSVVGGAEVKGLPPCNFPAIYNFGDSNSDTGGCSAALAPLRSPDGETFFGKPTGRISDGRLIIDFMAEQLGLPYLNSYLDSLGTNYSHGANFAVAVKNISRLPRPEHFSKALYTIDIGQNDAVRTTFLSNPLEQIPDMINQLAQAVQNLYNKGGRTFWIHNIGPIGCMPIAQNSIPNRTAESFDQNGCLNRWTEMAIEFNKQLKDKVIKLRKELPEAALTYVDVYRAKYELISNAKNLGFTNPLRQCTKHHETINGIKVEVGLCRTPSTYISWDGTHYTEAANRLIAKSILNGSLSDPPLPITHACHKQVPM